MYKRRTSKQCCKVVRVKPGRYVYGSYTYRGGCSSVGQTPYERLAYETKGIVDSTAQS